MMTKGTVEMDQLNRVTDTGIDAVGIYAQATGRSAADVQSDLSDGIISSMDFISTVSTAFEEGTNGVLNISGAAKEAGATWATTIANAKAAITRGWISLIDNANTKVYEGKTAAQLVKELADDYRMNTGTLENTQYVIGSRVEENTSLFEMIENALDLTLTNTGQMFVLYDDYGKLTLKNLSSMYVRKKNKYLMIDDGAGEDFDYTSSIDDNTYNRVKLTYDNEDTGHRDVYIAQHGKNINKWGVLQYYETLQKGENGQAKADALLSLYNKKTRNLKINNVIGDNRVRAGSMLVVNLNLGDMKVKNFMLVEKCQHTYKNNEHFMNLTLRGGEFVA